MTEMQALEQRFWAKVWHCQHRWPCKKCYWPWAAQGITLYDDPVVCWLRQRRYAVFNDPWFSRPIRAHRLASIVGTAGGCLLFPGRFVEACHRCDYGYCCHYSHVVLGASAENMRDTRGKSSGPQRGPYVYFPDGRRITFSSPYFPR